MNTQEFVDVIQKFVVDRTGPGVVSQLRDPQGRNPRPELVALSRWYKGLSIDDRAMIDLLLAYAVRHTVFGVYEVLDGSVKVDDAWVPGDHFELRHVHGDQVDVISGGDTSLHEFM